MADYTYTKTPVTLDSLEQEIADASLAASLTGTVSRGDQLKVSFDAALSEGDEATLNAVVVNHAAPSPKPGYTALELKDGVDEPATVADEAFIYVDVADGNLKIKFGDGVVKTIMTDE